MAFDGNGNYNPPAPEYPLQPQTVISSADMNTIILDIASALGNCMTRDSQGAPSVDLNLFTKKIVNLGAATNPNDAMRKVDVETYAITATTDRDMAGFRLKNLPAVPVAGTDAVSADYVNTAQTDRSMNGHHLLGAPAGPYASAEYVPKQYVDDQDALKASLAGATYTGTQDFTGATTTVATQGPSDSSTKAASTAFVQSVAMTSALPGIAGNALKTLRVNAGETDAEWVLGLPVATSNEGKALVLDGAAAPKWANPPRTWANWTLITTNAATFTVPDLVNEIRAYVFGGGGNGSSSVGGGGGGGGGCTFGTIPCKPGEVFTFDNTSGAVLKKGATAYLSANNGSNGAGSTGGAAGTAGTIGSGLGITASGAYTGGAGANGNGSNLGGGGGSSGSPLGNGFSGTSGTGSGGGGGGGWGSSGSVYCGGGVGSYDGSDGIFTGSAAVDANSRPASRDWSNAFTDPLLRMCNGVAPILSALSLVSEYAGNHGGAGCGGGSPRQAGAYTGGNGGLGAGGGPSRGNARAGHGGFGGGGACCEQGATGANAFSGSGGIAGGGGGAITINKQGTGGSAGVIIFW